jgi:uncharacterized protein YbjT (DUF2867 family)
VKLLILGASGGVGRWATRLAAEKGHRVRVLVRPAAAFDPPPGVEVMRGEALDPGTLERAVAGVDAVLCCLGQRRSGRSPWSRPLSPADLMERVIRLLIPAMSDAHVRRLVVVSAGGVAESEAQLTGPTRWLVRQGRIGEAYRDLAAMERALADSGLDWLAARPVTLIDGGPTGQAREVERYRFTSTVRRSDVAAWMLVALEFGEPLGGRRVLLGG